jgi:chromosomal replication initiation ATPase DnaA
MVIEQATLCKAEGDNSLYAEMWAKVRSALQDIRNEPSTVRWLDSLSVSNIDSGHIVLIAPTRFAREWIKNNLASDLLRLWKEHISSLLGIKIIVGRKLNSGLQTSVMIQDMPLFEATTHIDNNPQNKNNLHNSVQKTNSTYLVQALRSDAVSISTPVIENNENDTIDCDFEERYINLKILLWVNQINLLFQHHKK